MIKVKVYCHCCSGSGFLTNLMAHGLVAVLVENLFKYLNDCSGLSTLSRA